MINNKRYILAALLLIVVFIVPDFASASTLNQASIRLGRLGEGASSANDMLVTFKLNNTPTSVAKIAVTFPSGFTLTSGSPTVSTSGFPNTPAGITAPPGSLTASVTSAGAGNGGLIVVSGLTSANLNSTSLYGFDIPTGSITNPSTAGAYTPSVASENSGGSAIDTTTTPVYIYGSSPNGDQITVNETVAPSFSFQLSANSDTIPNVNPSDIETSGGVTMTVATNSPLGYTAYVKSANNALTSATTGTPIPGGPDSGSPNTISAGTSDYGFYPYTGPAASVASGSITYDSEYNIGSGNSNEAGGFNGTNFSSFVERNGYTNADQIILKERVAVSATIGYANDYTDTLTVVAAGNF